MPRPIKISDLPIQESPASAAWEKRLLCNPLLEKRPSIEEETAFYDGWNAALAWIPFRIQQFREIEEALREEIEELKRAATKA